jgi:GNAT superfamily N-acetyltransferase
MGIPDGYHDVPAGKLAAVVTYLEMSARPPSRGGPADVPWTLRQVEHPALDWYRDLYRRVGADWLWISRLGLADDDLSAIVNARDVEVYALGLGERDEGILELDFRVAGECEIAFFGVAPSLVGKGAGRWLMTRAIARAWARPITRLWLHTCTLDSPAAPGFYLRSGFTPYARKVEVFDDPRLTGVLPRTAAPQVPIVEPRAAAHDRAHHPRRA